MKRIKSAALFTLKTFFAIVAINLVFTVVIAGVLIAQSVH